MNRQQFLLGRRLAKRFPQPQIRTVNGTKIVTLPPLEGLTQDELVALSEFYRVRYGAEQ